MKFLIRDDDTCAFTSPEDLIRCYGEVWDRVPVNLSVTPFRVPGDYDFVPEGFRGGTEPLPLANNTELIEFLRELIPARKVHVALHGYHHTLPRGLPEYVGETDLWRKTAEGKAYLEDLLGCPVTTFVPPNNGLGREGFEAVVGNGLNLVNVPSLVRPGRRPFRPENFWNFLRVRYYRDVKKMRYPYVLRFGDHLEVGHHSVAPSQRMEVLEDGFARCAGADGVFIFAVHYHAFAKPLRTGEPIRDVLTHFLERAAALPDVEYLTYQELWER